MTDDLKARALDWRKRHDGGRLCVWWPAGSKPGDDSQPILAIAWDHGGTNELGAFYNAADADKMQLICDIFNAALEDLAPSERDWWGTRTYLEESAGD